MKTACWRITAALSLGPASAAPPAAPEPPASALTRLGAAWLAREDSRLKKALQAAGKLSP